MKKDYAWSLSKCACECSKKCDIDQYLKGCACVKSVIDSLVIPCDKILDTSETETINSNCKKATYKYFYPFFITNLIDINNRCYLL